MHKLIVTGACLLMTAACGERASAGPTPSVPTVPVAVPPPVVESAIVNPTPLAPPRIVLDALVATRPAATDLAATELLALRTARTSLAALPETPNALADPLVAPLVDLELGLAAAASGDCARAVDALEKAATQSPGAARSAVLTLLDCLVKVRPQDVTGRFADFEKRLDPDDPDARAKALGALAAAQEATGQVQTALATRVRRYLEEPVSLATPDEAPMNAKLTAPQLLARAERLLEGNRNERAQAAFVTLEASQLSADERCRRSFGRGLAARKLRSYAASSEAFAELKGCADTELVRRGRYLEAKVVSIKSGLAAIDLIESFVKDNPGHSMSDDMLFWAGDLYQRRGKRSEATRYFEQTQAVTPPGDHCAEARWRLAWMSFRAGEWAAAEGALTRLLSEDGCVTASYDRARATYWLARTALAQNDGMSAAQRLERVMALDPLGFYAQLALRQLERLDPARANTLASSLRAPPASPRPALCAGRLAERVAFRRAVALLERGLVEDAARELETLAGSKKDILASSHASAVGQATRGIDESTRALAMDACGPEQERLLLAFLLDAAGVRGKAQWLLRTEFADVLDRLPDATTWPIWRAAYPLAFRDALAAAESESRLPDLLLQSLAREESAYDVKVVSWAGAYGLTQLLLSSGRGAGKLLEPRVTLANAEELLEPTLNARLGGALLKSLLERFGGSVPLALAAYNAGDDVAMTWWKRHEAEPLDVLAEEISIKETRGYVQRVVRTWGIYRWLHAGEAPHLPVPLELPRIARK